MLRSATRRAFTAAMLLLVTPVVSSCGPAMVPGASDQAANASASQSVGGPRGRLTFAWNREPDNLSPRFGASGGGAEFDWVFSSGLTYFDLQGVNHPMMARQIPSQENRDWVINPDARAYYGLSEVPA